MRPNGFYTTRQQPPTSGRMEHTRADEPQPTGLARPPAIAKYHSAVRETLSDIQHNTCMAALSRPLLIVSIFAGCSMLLLLLGWQWWRQQPPDFTRYPAGETRKTVFFNYLGPIIDRENERIQAHRERLLKLRNGNGTKRDRLLAEELTGYFDLPAELSGPELIDPLLAHVDTVPKSLALAQAAKESAWGTSRFSIEGNNYFGQRCYFKGCGMIPEARAPGAKFEVRRFESVEESVASYMNNINSHREYKVLRDYRAEQRRSGKPVSGIQAAERMTQYSERRQDYVDELQSLIHFNHLDKLP